MPKQGSDKGVQTAAIPPLGRLVGDVFKPIAEASGLSNKEIAKRSGLSESYVSLLLRGNAGDPAMSKILSLADAFRPGPEPVSELRSAPSLHGAIAQEQAALLLETLAAEMRSLAISQRQTREKSRVAKDRRRKDG